MRILFPGRFWSETIRCLCVLRFSTSPFPLLSGSVDILIYTSSSDCKVYLEDV